MFQISRAGSRSLRRAATLSTLVALTLAATASMAAAGSQAATPRAASKCRVVVQAAPWSIHGSGSGNRYTVAASGMSCASATRWVTKFTQEVGKGLGQTLQGPSGYTCRSFSEAASGDSHVYSGICIHPPHNVPSFEWTPTK